MRKCSLKGAEKSFRIFFVARLLLRESRDPEVLLLGVEKYCRLADMCKHDKRFITGFDSEEDMKGTTRQCKLYPICRPVLPHSHAGKASDPNVCLFLLRDKCQAYLGIPRPAAERALFCDQDRKRAKRMDVLHTRLLVSFLVFACIAFIDEHLSKSGECYPTGPKGQSRFFGHKCHATGVSLMAMTGRRNRAAEGAAICRCVLFFTLLFAARSALQVNIPRTRQRGPQEATATGCGE